MMTRALLCVVLGAAPLAAQEIILVPGFTRDFRGLAARGEEMWAAGRAGTFARSKDGGRGWKAGRIPGADNLVLVDVEVLGRDTACVLATSFDGGLGRAYRTTDGGEKWALSYELRHPQVFLDGMAFWDSAHGIAFGDPVNGGFFVLRTSDGCASWTEVPASALPTPLAGEAGFAASGTAITIAGDGYAWIGTGGGAIARVLRTTDRGASWTAVPTPMPAGTATGIFGVAFLDTLTGVAVGGNYQEPAGDAPTVLSTSDGGLTWALAGSVLPAGVRFGAVALPQARAFVAAGPSGVGVSLDTGKTWTAVDTLPAFALFARDREAWIGGTAGWIARVDLDRVLSKEQRPDR